MKNWDTNTSNLADFQDFLLENAFRNSNFLLDQPKNRRKTEKG